MRYGSHSTFVSKRPSVVSGRLDCWYRDNTVRERATVGRGSILIPVAANAKEDVQRQMEP